VGEHLLNHSNIEAVLNKRQPAWGFSPKNKALPKLSAGGLVVKHPAFGGNGHRFDPSNKV